MENNKENADKPWNWKILSKTVLDIKHDIIFINKSR